MKEHTFTMDLTSMGIGSRVLLDGEDITSLLRGVNVSASVEGRTIVKLSPDIGAKATLTIKLPESQIVVSDEP